MLAKGRISLVYLMLLVVLMALSALACGESGTPRSSPASPTSTRIVAEDRSLTRVVKETETSVPQTCQDLLRSKASMTDAQWEAHLDDLEGEHVYGWKGRIDEVSEGGLGFFADGYTVRVIVEGGCEVLFTSTDPDQALQLSKGQEVTIDGVLDFFGEAFGFVVYLEDDPLIDTDSAVSDSVESGQATGTPLPTETGPPPRPTYASSGVATVINASVNLRAGPGTDFAIIGYASRGDKFDVFAKNEDGSWYQLDQPGQTWIAAWVVELDQDASVIPVAPTATPTPPPTKTPLPTATGTNTPTPPLYVEYFNVTDYSDSDGDLWLYGEVRNLGTLPAKSIKLTATLYNVDGNVLAVSSTYADMPLEFNLWFTGVLYPTEQAPFSILLEEPGQWTEWDISLTYREASYSDYEEHYRDLEVKNHFGRIVSSFGENYRVSGEIENTGEMETGPVRIIITLYNESGQVVGIENMLMTDVDPLMPGEVAPFSTEFLYVRGTVASYQFLIRSIRH